MASYPTVMLIGPGGLGGLILQFLSRESGFRKIYVCDRDSESALRQCDLALLSAAAFGRYPDISFHRLDLNEAEAAAETLARLDPDIILSTATMLTWWLPSLLPDDQLTLIGRAKFGMWLPVHLTLTLKLMDILEQADYRGFTATAPFPDAVNAICANRGRAPGCGIGNVDEIAAYVRLAAAQKMNAEPEEVDVSIVAHHALNSSVLNGVRPDPHPPFHMKVTCGGGNVLDTVPPEALLYPGLKIPGGATSNFVTAGSAVRLLQALGGEKPVCLHTPSPGGLPGGYPVRVSAQGIDLSLPDDITPDRAVAINEDSHRFDGIERIEADGTAVFVQESVEIFRDLFGYECERMHPGESESRARELIGKFREYAARFGVSI